MTGDATGACVATSPIPVDGQCKGLPSNYTYYATGHCGDCIHWLDCDTAKAGVQACYEAVLNDPKCSGGYFTYVERGAGDCGCMTSDESPPVLSNNKFADCYAIADLGETVDLNQVPESKEIRWTADGVMALVDANRFSNFGKPVAGDAVTQSQYALAEDDGFTQEMMINDGMWSSN